MKIYLINMICCECINMVKARLDSSKIRYINVEFGCIELYEDLSKEKYKSLIDYLKSKITMYDIVLVSDFGHGFITNKMIKVINKNLNIIQLYYNISTLQTL